MNPASTGWVPFRDEWLYTTNLTFWYILKCSSRTANRCDDWINVQLKNSRVAVWTHLHRFDLNSSSICFVKWPLLTWNRVPKHWETNGGALENPVTPPPLLITRLPAGSPLCRDGIALMMNYPFLFYTQFPKGDGGVDGVWVQPKFSGKVFRLATWGCMAHWLTRSIVSR